MNIKDLFRIGRKKNNPQKGNGKSSTYHVSLNPSKKLSSKNGELLTKWETDYIVKNQKCPDCSTGELLEGPSGGMSVNIMCDKCGSKFNWSRFFNVFIAERISDRSPNKNYIRQQKINKIIE